MAKVVYASLKSPKSANAKSQATRTLHSKTVTAPDGSKLTISTVDADSPTFGEDMTVVFRRNVARARRENKRLRDQADHVASNT